MTFGARAEGDGVHFASFRCAVAGPGDRIAGATVVLGQNEGTLRKDVACN
jgi:hypothetical protein